MAKCPNCNSSNNKVKYDKFLECKDCGQHFYGVYEEEIEGVDELPEGEEITDIPVVEFPVKRVVGKPAVKKVAK